MIAYHFTSRQLLKKVQEEGITKCGVPWKTKNPEDRPPMMNGLQWLTLADSFDDQSWHVPSLFAPHRMRKVDFRIAVSVPKLASHLVIPWKDFARHHGLPVATYFDTFPDSRWWLILRGKVPPEWFIETMRNPAAYDVPELLLGAE